MQRQIMFRVWDKQTKSMLSDFHLFGEVTLLGGIHAWQHEQGNKSKSSIEALGDLEIMQFTGRKDKTGKDIYDGDRVRRMKDGIEGEVFWKYDGWFVKVDGSIDARLHDWEHYCESIEVIGTIYDEI